MKQCLVCCALFEDEGWVCPRCGQSPPVRDGFICFSPELAGSNDGFDASYFPRLARLEEGNFWFVSRNKLIVWALRKYFPRARSFLEVGCGTGFVLTAVRSARPHMTLYGSEIFTEGLAFSKERLPEATLYQMDARAIPFKNEFDVAGAFDVLEHIEEDELSLRQMYESVKPGGGIIVSVPQHRWLWSVIDEFSFHKRRYTRAELVGKIRRAGFRVERVTSFVSLLLPVMALSRFRLRLRPESFDPSQELQDRGLFNSVAMKLSASELYLIRKGVPLSAGGSLMIIARRED